MMAAVHRAIFIWLWLLVFSVLLVLRLDRKVHWSWFAVFFPVWILDMVFFAYAIVNIVEQLRRYKQSTGASASNNINNTMTNQGVITDLKRSCTRLFGIIFKLGFEICLCIKLDYPDSSEFRFVYAMIPLWILFIAILIDLTMRLNVLRLQRN